MTISAKIELLRNINTPTDVLVTLSEDEDSGVRDFVVHGKTRLIEDEIL